jgi:hypothetical protein
MTRFTLQAILATGVLLVPFIPRAEAQPPKKVIIDPHQRHGAPVPAVAGGPTAVVIPEQPGYVKLDAPLYPVPRPNIPYYVGSAMITNQALAPHEFLYPHYYRALYPPFYYRVKGKWFGAFGWSHAHENWELVGTEVEVKYSSHIPLIYRQPFSRLFD